MSQDDFARAIRDAGTRLGAPNDANKRLVQRWEAGTIQTPRPVYARALEAATGMPLEALGFADADLPRVTPNGSGGHDLAPSPEGESPDAAPRGQAAGQGNYTGVWLSRYEYYSSGREESFVDAHYVILVQHEDRLTARSLPQGSLNPGSQLTMDLTVDGSVITGTWVEQTAAAGYYRGARYHGAIQLLAEPTGRQLRGKWIGFGKEMDINTGPWELTFQDASIDKATVARYDRPLSDVQPQDER